MGLLIIRGHLKSTRLFPYTPFVTGSLKHRKGFTTKGKGIVVAHVNHLGPKAIGNTRQHTIIRYARPFLYKIDGWAEVERWASSTIFAAGRVQRGIKIWYVDAGLKVRIYDTTESQFFFLYTHQQEAVIERLRAEFESCEIVS